MPKTPRIIYTSNSQTQQQSKFLPNNIPSPPQVPPYSPMSTTSNVDTRSIVVMAIVIVGVSFFGVFVAGVAGSNGEHGGKGARVGLGGVGGGGVDGGLMGAVGVGFEIVNSDGKVIRFNYSRPEFFRPAYQPQQAPTLIQYQPSKQTQQFLRILRNDFQFSTRLSNNWMQKIPSLFMAQYLKLHQIYNLNSQVPQKPITILTPIPIPITELPKNLQLFMNSINQQNYSNYRVFFVKDGRIGGEFLRKFMEVGGKFGRLSNRMWVVGEGNGGNGGNGRVGVLGLQDYVIRTYCQPGDIIMEISIDGLLIGKQVLNLFNRMYQINKNAWFYYSNYIQSHQNPESNNLYADTAYPGINIQINEIVQRSGFYRTAQFWLMTGIRTYLRDLYMRIPIRAFVDSRTGRYYTDAADMFVAFAVSELAGSSHTYFYSGYPYLHRKQPSPQPQPKCSTITHHQHESRIQTPFRPLSSLTDSIKTIKNYRIPVNIMRAYVHNQFEQKECQAKEKGIQGIFRYG